MFELATVPPDSWWNPIGEKVYRPRTQRPSRIIYSTGKHGGHLWIMPVSRFRNLFHVGSIMFHENKNRDDISRIFKGVELATLFKSPNRDISANDPEYAARYGADFAVPGKFILAGDRASFPCPGTGHKMDPNFCLLIKGYMTEEIDRLIRTGKVDHK